MNRTRVVLLGLLAVLVAVWVSSASLPSAPVESAAEKAARAAAAAQPAPLPFDVTAVAERLRVQRREAPSPRRDGRNPFEFAATRVTPPPHVAAPSTPAPSVASEPATPPPPPLTLSGIVDKTDGDQKVRTAVISGLGQLFFAKTGDTIATRYEVTAITPDVVELRDIYTKQTTRLALH